MKPIAEVFENLRSRSDCAFRPPTGLPKLREGHQLPDDLRWYYSQFSGAELFGERDDDAPDLFGPTYRLLPADKFIQIGHAICGEESALPIQKSWYSLADVQDGNFLAIDCHPARLGCCYDAFHETIDDLSYCNVIALSFTELMNVAVKSERNAWWLEPNAGHGYADKLRES